MGRQPTRAALCRWTAALMQPFFIPIGIITLFGFAGNYIGTYEPLLTGKIVDSLTAGDVPLFWRMIALVTIIQIGSLLFSLIGSWVQYLLQKKITVYTESRLFLTMMYMPPQSTAAANRGKILNVFLSDLGEVTGIYTQKLPALVLSAGTMAVIGFRLIRIDGFFFGLTALFSVVPVFLAHYFGQKQAAVSEVQRKQQDEYTDFVDETVSGLHEIKNYSAARFFKTRFQSILAEIFRYLKKSTFLDMRAQAAHFTASFITNMALFIIVGYSVLIGKNTVGTIVSALMYSQQFRSLVSSCAETYRGMLISLVAAERLKDCFDARTGIHGITVRRKDTFFETEKNDTALYKNSAAADKNAAQKSLIIQDLSFSYTGTQFIFRNFNAVFTFPHLYLIKGENGAGKTTLLNIIAGLLRPVNTGGGFQTGQDGKTADAAGMPIGSGTVCFAGFRSSAVAYVSQNPFIFSGTVLHNLTFGKLADNARLAAVLEQTRLKKVIESLPNGLQTRIGGAGHILSQGQMQRLALARCLLHGSSIILFDEVETAFDSESTEALLHILSELKTEKLILMVTHSSRYDSVADGIITVP